ncbi:MAG: SDR family oxidoreductase [Oscillospiraceae bacterium]
MKTILITGASGDIGRAIARVFPNDRLILQYHLADPDFSLEFPRATAVKCDIRKEEEVRNLFRTAGEVNVLVNNCGISGIKLFDTLTLAEWENMLAVNLTGSFLTCREAIPAMIRKKSGCIINIASMWGEVGASCEVHYSAAKGGLIAMTKALAKELGPSGIRVNCLSPGYIDTKMNAHLSTEERRAFCDDIPLGRPGTPREVAAAVRFLAEDATYMTGQTLGLNGGLVL